MVYGTCLGLQVTTHPAKVLFGAHGQPVPCLSRGGRTAAKVADGEAILVPTSYGRR